MEGVLNFDSYAREPITESRRSIQRNQNTLTNVCLSTLLAQAVTQVELQSKCASKPIKLKPSSKQKPSNVRPEFTRPVDHGHCQ